MPTHLDELSLQLVRDVYNGIPEDLKPFVRFTLYSSLLAFCFLISYCIICSVIPR